MWVSCYERARRTDVTSYLCHHCHKVCGSGLVIQSLTRFDSQDTAVAIDGKLGKRGGLLMFKTTWLTGGEKISQDHFIHDSFCSYLNLLHLKLFYHCSFTHMSKSSALGYWPRPNYAHITPSVPCSNVIKI